MLNDFDTLGMSTMCPLTRDQANLAALAGLDDELADAAIARMTDEELAGLNDAAVDLHAAGETARMGSAGRRCRCRQRKAVRELKRRYAGTPIEIRDVPPQGLGMYEPPHNPALDPDDFERWAAASDDDGMEGLGALGKSFFSKIGKFFSNVGKAVGKFAAPALSIIGGAVLGPVAGALVGGAGSLIGGAAGIVSPAIGQSITDATANAAKSITSNASNPIDQIYPVLALDPTTGQYRPFSIVGNPTGAALLYYDRTRGAYTPQVSYDPNYGATGGVAFPGYVNRPAPTNLTDALQNALEMGWNYAQSRIFPQPQTSPSTGFYTAPPDPAPQPQQQPQQAGLGNISPQTLALIGGGLALLLVLRK